MRRVGIGSYTVPHAIRAGVFDVFGLLALAEQVGAEVVQYCDNLPLMALLPQELSRFKEQADGAGISIEVGTRGIDPETLEYEVELARRVGSPFLRLVLDRANDHPTVAQAITRLAECLPIFEEAGVKIGIENHDRFRALEWIEIVEALGRDSVGIVLDTANSLGCLEAPEETLRLLGPYAINLHWKPISIERVPTMLGFDIRGCSSRDTPLIIQDWLLGTTTESVILEQWVSEQSTNKETVTLELEWLNAGLIHLREEITSLA